MTQDLENAAGVRSGDVLAGKYRVDRVLGAGGMGVVVMARHLGLDERVAIKFLLPSLLTNADVVERFAREARAAVKIKSEHVARVSDVGTLENGAPYMVMEFLEGEDLAAWLLRKGPLPVEQAVDFILQACVAVADAHALGIVHRDLKPANLFCVRRSDGQPIVKVLDFGISKITHLSDSDASRALTQTTSVMGSPFYMSPEQMQSARDVDPQTDIWALGVSLYELLTGARPFVGESYAQLAIRVATASFAPVRSLRPDAPPGIEAVLLKCLEKDKRRRFANVADLAVALGPFGSVRSRPSIERVVGILRASGISTATVALPASTPAVGSSGTNAPLANTASPRTTGVTGRTATLLTVGVVGAVLLVSAFVAKQIVKWRSAASAASSAMAKSIEDAVSANGPAARSRGPSGGSGERTTGATGTIAASGRYVWDSAAGPPVPVAGSSEGDERFVGRIRLRGSDELWIVAFEGAKLGEIWRAGPFGTYSDGYRSTPMVVVGHDVVVADYRADVHVYDLANGRELRTLHLADRAKAMCASPDGATRAWIESVDGKKLFFDADTATTTPGARPAWCPDLWAASYDCRGWLKRGAPRLTCRGPDAAPRVAGFGADNVVEDGGLAVALGKRQPGTEVPTAMGFDPETKRVRWQRPLASGDQARIQESTTTSIMDELTGGRFVAPYQTTAGEWHFVAFDARTGEPQWDTPLPPIVGVDHPEAFALSTSRLYVVRASSLEVFDAKTGALMGTLGDG